jgi:hypothetical protein
MDSQTGAEIVVYELSQKGRPAVCDQIAVPMNASGSAVTWPRKSRGVGA